MIFVTGVRSTIAPDRLAGMGRDGSISTFLCNMGLGNTHELCPSGAGTT
jgi:hypothetical protein